MASQSTEFKSVDRYVLQQAFAIAHHGARMHTVNKEGKKRLRMIAKLIWQSCGEESPYRKEFAPEVEAALRTFSGELERQGSAL